MTNSRNKGSAFERTVAAQIEALTGVSFKRDLEQYRNADRGDLLADDPAFPFLIECKAYKKGDGCKREWKAQASKAAAASGKIPCVVWKYNYRAIRVAVPLQAIGYALGQAWEEPGWAEIDLPALAYMAGEIMAIRAMTDVHGVAV